MKLKEIQIELYKSKFKELIEWHLLHNFWDFVSDDTEDFIGFSEMMLEENDINPQIDDLKCSTEIVVKIHQIVVEHKYLRVTFSSESLSFQFTHDIKL